MKAIGDDVATITAEAAAHAVLRVVCDHPGQMGRLRVARVVGGYSVPLDDEVAKARLRRYAVEVPWPLRETVSLVDTMLDGALLAQTAGPRPTLVLTRAGWHALEALEQCGPSGEVGALP